MDEDGHVNTSINGDIDSGEYAWDEKDCSIPVVLRFLEVSSLAYRFYPNVSQIKLPIELSVSWKAIQLYRACSAVFSILLDYSDLVPTLTRKDHWLTSQLRVIIHLVRDAELICKAEDMQLIRESHHLAVCEKCESSSQTFMLFFQCVSMQYCTHAIDQCFCTTIDGR